MPELLLGIKYNNQIRSKSLLHFLSLICDPQVSRITPMGAVLGLAQLAAFL